jgi:riboflavin biosynthesis pyrimidine reductase
MISPAFGLALEAKATTAPTLADSYGPWVGIRSNHVITLDGEFAGADGSSRSITQPIDRQLLIALRAKADLIVVDAATARAEQYRLPSSGAPLAVFSRSGVFSGIPALEETTDKCFLFSPEAPKDSRNHTHVPIRSSANPLQELSEWAEGEGFSALLLEAGPTLSRTAFDNKLVSNSALTISGATQELDFIATAHPFDKSATLTSVAHFEGGSFTYWRH